MKELLHRKPNSISTIAVASCVGLVLATTGSALAQEAANPDDAKFAFQLGDLGTGSRPDTTGMPRPIGYEYCLPKRPEAILMVGNTDPTGRIESRSKGTIGCADEMLLATGNTGQPDFLVVLRAIASHDFVDKIILLESP